METRDVVNPADASAPAGSRTEAAAPLADPALWNPLRSRMNVVIEPFSSAEDPPVEGTDFSVTIEVARKLQQKLTALGLEVFPKTSGADGMHLWLPLEREYTYEQTRTFAEIVARIVAAENPKLVTMERVVAKRPKGKVLIDSVQNAFGRPLASPWSLRAKPKAPLSAPLWPEELKRGLTPEIHALSTLLVFASMVATVTVMLLQQGDSKFQTPTAR